MDFDKKIHDLVITGFRLGRIVILYGSILFLTLLGIMVWTLGTINFFNAIWKTASEGLFFYGNSLVTLQNAEISAIRVLDLYLLSIVFFSIAIGLYGVFIRPEKTGIKLPLRITAISQVEKILFGAIVTMLLLAALNVLRYDMLDASEITARICMIGVVVLVISVYLSVRYPKEKGNFR